MFHVPTSALRCAFAVLLYKPVKCHIRIVAVAEDIMGLYNLFHKKPKPGAGPLANLESTMKAIAMAAFPNGQKDITDGGTEIRRLSNNKLSQDVAENLFEGIKPLLFIVPEKLPEPHVKNSIRNRTGGELTEHEVNAIYRYLADDQNADSRGNEGTIDRPVVIALTSSIKGVQAEYDYLTNRFGERDLDWELVSHEQSRQGKRVMECFVIKNSGGRQETVYFDITSFMPAEDAD